MVSSVEPDALELLAPVAGLNSRQRAGEFAMGRTALVAGLWFAFWMIAGAALGGWLAPKTEAVSTGIYFGLFNGAFFAVLTSFAWPWIMPRFIDRWMRRGEAGEG
jgi:hypothetical protein